MVRRAGPRIAEAFGVVVPDLPGCFSAGDTFDEAVSNASEAIALWVEDAIDNGQPVPRPSSLDGLRASPEWSGPEWIWGFAGVDPALFDGTAFLAPHGGEGAPLSTSGEQAAPNGWGWILLSTNPFQFRATLLTQN
ncbi:type II toxin-antitoxin system HicB family antitoxin [Gluconacetobacter azotocaptans]|uniref:type II toxin-antitoxin system HicB family antitoxin n=1 Tax=Gluconacetobacter azotocaptans TaxID=142834 RepID=UPI001F045993|nr:type II toxin-antitoxin system HicB family antitoxin [Gluconacetobacter azotocaptans]